MGKVYVVIEREYAPSGTNEWVDHVFTNREAAEACATSWERRTNCEASVQELELEESWMP